MLKTKLLPHQQKTVEFGLKTKFYGDYSIMGTGKSLSALALIDSLGMKAAIVAPPYLVQNWLNEIRKHTTLVGSPHFSEWRNDADIIVVPYSKLPAAEETFKNVEIIVADEGQYLKNLEAKRTMAFHNFFYKYTPKYFAYLSGTPIKNRLPDIYSMLVLWSKGPNKPSILDKYPSFYTFCCRFTNVKATQYGTKFEGMKNVEELRKYINPFSIRHGDEVLDLPALSRSSVVVSYSKNDELQKEWDRYISGGSAIDSRSKREAAIAKVPFTVSYVSEILSEQKLGPVIIFSDHVQPVEMMALQLSNYRVRTIHGQTAIAKRDEAVQLLNNHQLDVLICTIGAASTGFNLTASNILIFNDISWISSDIEQAEKRIHRIGSSKPCRIIHVVGSATDEYIYNLVTNKAKVIQKVIYER